MKIVFLPEARSEFLAAVKAYEDVRAGLGIRFRDEVDRCVLWISDHPELYRLRSAGYRRINLRTFPHHIPFVIRNDSLWIVAIAHSSREPEYWIERRQSTD